MHRTAPFHLLYVPGEAVEGTHDRVLSLIQTEDPDYILLMANFVSGSVVMHLEAENMQEAQDEMQSLGLYPIPCANHSNGSNNGHRSSPLTPVAYHATTSHKRRTA